MPVPVAPVLKRSLPIYLDYSARTESIAAISLQAKVSGYIQAQPAADGSDVKPGDLLYKIDPRDFQAALDQANAQLQRDQANIDYLRSNFDRGSELTRNGWLNKDTFDQRESNLKQAQATLASDQAAQRQAELNLGYTTITAPMTGTIGNRTLRVGQYVQAGTQLMAVVPLAETYIVANFKETQLTDVHPGQPVDISVDMFPDADIHGHFATACRRPAARNSPCCRRTTPPATSPRSCSASRSRSCSTATTRWRASCAPACR